MLVIFVVMPCAVNTNLKLAESVRTVNHLCFIRFINNPPTLSSSVIIGEKEREMENTNTFKYKGVDVNFGGFYEGKFCFYIIPRCRVVMVSSIEELENNLFEPSSPEIITEQK